MIAVSGVYSFIFSGFITYFMVKLYWLERSGRLAEKRIDGLEWGKAKFFSEDLADTRLQVNVLQDSLGMLKTSFKPRVYQEKIVRAFGLSDRVVVVAPRCTGKDYTAFNLMVGRALLRVGHYTYFCQTKAWAKTSFFTLLHESGDGVSAYKLFDCIPSREIIKIDTKQLRLTLRNGSCISFHGSTAANEMIGLNVQGAVFSECAMYSTELLFKLLFPVISVNKGFVLWITTARALSVEKRTPLTKGAEAAIEFSKLWKRANKNSEYVTVEIQGSEIKDYRNISGEALSGALRSTTNLQS